MNDAPALLVLAAGMGSRYGGLKQLDPMGPSGEIMLDYAVYDAVRAGFRKVVFVIRRDIEEAFRQRIVRKYEDIVALEYAFQELDDLPSGFQPPSGRTRPWGTGHAVWSARHCLNGSFAVINADDFYGREAYALVKTHFEASGIGKESVAMVAYALDQTLSDHGSVNRGLCREINGMLASVEEITAIGRRGDGSIQGQGMDGQSVLLKPENPVSMNFWGFSSAVFPRMEERFRTFLEKSCGEARSEFYLPFFVDAEIRDGRAQCKLLRTGASWFGVTYPEDRQHVQEALRERHRSGEYPTPLFS